MYFGDTEAELAMMRIDAKIKRIYAEASEDIQKKIDDFNAQHIIQDAQWQKLLKDGKVTRDDYNKWRAEQIFIGNRWKNVKNDILSQIYKSNSTASRIINGERRAVFVENVNHAEYMIDKDFKFGLSFVLYDSATVTRLIKDDPQVLPEVSTDKTRDFAWGRKQITSAITQGIIQGESLDKIAKRIGDKLSNDNKNLMRTLARTAMTGAQNAGRIEAMHNAQEMGINVQKSWIATLDNRTRDSHQYLDGQIRDVDKPFVSTLGEIMYPGDHNAVPADVWNCRCTLGWEYPDYPSQSAKRIARREDGETEYIDDMSYEQWRTWKETGELPNKNQKPENDSIYDPNGYKPDKYDEEYKKVAKDQEAFNKNIDEHDKKLRHEASELDKEYRLLDEVQNKIRYYSAYEKFKSEDELNAYRTNLEESLKNVNNEIDELQKNWRRKRSSFANDEEYDKAFDEYIEKRQQLLDQRSATNKEYNELWQLNWKEIEQIRKYDGDIDAMQRRMAKIMDRQTEIAKEEYSSIEKKADYYHKVDAIYGIERTVSDIQDKGVEWLTPQRLTGQFDFDKVVERLGGGDLTTGSCASLALCYVGQKAGYDVIDFRGGNSQQMFSYNTRAVLNSIKENGGAVIKTNAKSSLTAAKHALKQMEDGKEYILTTGHHAAIVKSENGECFYLELQSGRENENGWHSFNYYGVEQTLKWRFDAKTRGKSDRGEAFLADVDDLSHNERLLKIMGYINTDPSEQMKGSAGSVK